jgi:hypothetical protein
MWEDLQPLLQSWPYEPGTIQVRTIQGEDGTDKLQLRLDLGILQMETEGRPDGQQPFGCESLLEHFERVSEQYLSKGKADHFKLNSEDCLKLQQEGMQYHHRYLAFFQLQNYEGVVRDSLRNLRLFDFVDLHAEKTELSGMFQQFRPYILMMLTRARAMLALEDKQHALAIKHIEWGLQEIQDFLRENSPAEALEQNSELQFLHNWMKEIERDRPLTPREKLRRQMQEAVENEDYERAARLRDALDELR